VSDPTRQAADADALADEFSDYYEGTLPQERRTELERRMAEDPELAAAYEEFVGTMRVLSGLHKMSRPQDFEQQVEDTIHRRSAGRFFGRRAFGDRIPFELLAVIALAIALALYVLLRRSDTGSLQLPAGDPAPEIHEDAKRVVPRP